MPQLAKKILFCMGLIILFVWLQHCALQVSSFWGNGWPTKVYAHGGGGGGDGGGGGGGDGGGGGGGDGGGDSGSAGCADGSVGVSDTCMSQSAVSPSESYGGEGGGFEPQVVLAINADEEALSKARDLDLTVERQIRLKNLGMVVTRFKVPKGVSPKAVQKKLSRVAGKVQYELNHYYEVAAYGREDDIRRYPNNMICWPTDCDACGFGIRLGMIDTRVMKSIAPLKGQKIVTRSFVSELEHASITHGTCIATILVGSPRSSFRGLLPAARLFVADTFSVDKNSKLHATALAVAQALDWLVSEKVQIINLSFAGPKNKLLEIAVKRVMAQNILLVAAAGNFGPTAPPAYPAAYDGVIAVTAIDRFFRPYRFANRGKYIGFAAPGVGIWLPRADGNGQLKSGTSYASAYCTGLLGLLMSRQLIGDAKSNVMDLLRRHCIDLGPTGKDEIFGWGLIKNWLGCTIEN